MQDEYCLWKEGENVADVPTPAYRRERDGRRHFATLRAAASLYVISKLSHELRDELRSAWAGRWRPHLCSLARLVVSSRRAIYIETPNTRI